MSQDRAAVSAATETAAWPSGRGPVAYGAGVAILAIVYVALARLGLSIHPVHVFATLVWPPTGVSLVALLLWGYRFWPGIAIGALAANVWTGAPWPVAAGIALGNTAEALLGAWTLRRLPGFRSSLDRLRDVLGLVVLGSVVSSMVSATIGVGSLFLGGVLGPGAAGAAWRAWWLGDAIGDLIVAPLLLTWKPDRGASGQRRPGEAAALGLLLCATSLSVFEFANATAALLLPLLIWSAVRFELRGAVRATFLVAGIALFATARGHGPAVSGDMTDSLFLLQTFMAVTAATFLVLGAMTAERRRAEEQQRKAEDGIRESESRYRSLAEAIDQLMWINDANGRAIYVNPKWEEKVGFSVEGGRGIRWEELLHPDDVAAFMDLRGKRIPPGEPYQTEFRLQMRDGQYRWMLTRVVPVHDSRGAVSSWFGCATDIHELKTTHEELVRTKEEAEAASRAKDRFLATLSHELRTPLTPVLAISSALEMRSDLPEGTRRQLEIVRRNAELEARLIDDMLDLTRIAKGKLQLSPEPVPLSEALDHVIEVCRPEASVKGITLERPASSRAWYVEADPARLRQALWNLVMNAVKFTPRGGRVELRTLPASPGRVSIEVSDTGAGIDPSNLTRIFEPFEQTGHRLGGLGLGLAISRALVEAHGGVLTAASEGLGRGATFRVELEALPEREAPVAEPVGAPTRLRKRGG